MRQAAAAELLPLPDGDRLGRHSRAAQPRPETSAPTAPAANTTATMFSLLFQPKRLAKRAAKISTP